MSHSAHEALVEHREHEHSRGRHLAAAVHEKEGHHLGILHRHHHQRKGHFAHSPPLHKKWQHECCGKENKTKRTSGKKKTPEDYGEKERRQGERRPGRRSE